MGRVAYRLASSVLDEPPHQGLDRRQLGRDLDHPLLRQLGGAQPAVVAPGEYTVTRFLSLVVALMTRPSIRTFSTRPPFTSSMNWEYSMGFWVLCRVLNWLKTVISTSATISQIAIFFTMLFKIPFLQ